MTKKGQVAVGIVQKKEERTGTHSQAEPLLRSDGGLMMRAGWHELAD